MGLSTFLQSVPSFKDFTRPELDALEQAMSVKDYSDGHVFLEEGKRVPSMFLIIEGAVVATCKHRRTRGTETIERLGPGDMFGLIALIEHRRGLATYTAIGEVNAASLPQSAFNLLYTARAPIAHHFQYLIARQLAHDVQLCANALLIAMATEDRGRLNEAWRGQSRL